MALAMDLSIFPAAGTLRYWQAWVFLGVFWAAQFPIMLYLPRHDPALLQRRLRGGPWAEKERAQKIIVYLASVGFIALLVVPAFDRRFGWSAMPLYVVILGDALVALGFFIVFLVFRENTFTSATVEVTRDQRVISTGPYAAVRHPMYAGASLYLIGMPLALGSCWGLLVLVPLIPVLVWRLVDEEKLLAKDLPGYTEYQRRMRSRLIPGVF